SSGLGTFVRDGLSTVNDSLPWYLEILQDIRDLNHQPVNFTNEGSTGPVDLDPLDGDGFDVDFTAFATNDFLAEKGFTLDTVQMGDDPNQFVYVVNTHLHATDPDTRAAQVQEIANYINQLADSSHPVLFMGDYNIIAGSDEYDRMMEILGHPFDI